MVDGIQLRLYLSEHDKHDGTVLYEWLLEQARHLGMPGGTVFRAIAGFGRHGKMHEEHYFELAADLPLMVEFLLSPQQTDHLLAFLANHHPEVFYVKTPCSFGSLGEFRTAATH